MLQAPSVSERLDHALEYVASRTPYAGAEVTVVPDDAIPLTWSSNDQEVSFLLRSLQSLGYLHWRATTEREIVVLAAAGYRRLEELGGYSAQNKRVFVAMSFDESLDAIYDDGLRPAITAAGFEPVRVDRGHHGDRIDSKILLEIRKCRALVADATLLRPSVFYEAGLAEGFGKPVFWTCREKMIEDKELPFDTRQFPHTGWKDAEDLRRKLQPLLEYRLSGRART